MNKVLLLDTNFSAKPIYDYLVSTGDEVYVAGNNPTDALAKSVPNYVKLDYSNVADVMKLISKLSIDYLVPGGNDLSYKVCSEINEKIAFYNIDSVENCEIINDKGKFRKFSLDIGLHVPHLLKYETIEKSLPVIIKPVDAYSGHGMSVINSYDKDNINKAVELAKKYSKTQQYLIEQFINGQLYSHSAFIVDQQIVIDFIVEEHCNVNQYVVDTSRVCYDFHSDLLQKIRKDIMLIVEKLNLVDGLLHTQFICDGDDFWLIEVTRRCPGDLYSKLIQYSTNFPYAEYYARPFIDKTKKAVDIKLDNSFIIRHTITSDKPITFNSIAFNCPLKIINMILLSLTGDFIKKSPFNRIGLLFMNFNRDSDLIYILNKTTKRELYTIL